MDASIYRNDISERYHEPGEREQTMLELAVLGLLKEKPMYGYELKKRLQERLGHSWSYGSLYPALKRLSKEEAVAMEYPKGEITRRKNVYRITETGERLFESLLEESGREAAEDRDAFNVRLAFFRYTRPETRQRLLERRRGYLQDHLARVSESLKTLRERMDAYSLALMQHEANETESGIRWLETMLEAERTQGQGAPS